MHFEKHRGMFLWKCTSETPCECNVGTSVFVAWVWGSALHKKISVIISQSELLFYSEAVRNITLQL